MAWLLRCGELLCRRVTPVANIVDLIRNHTGCGGWLTCPCGKAAYIEKAFDLQEPGQTWEPFLRGIIPLGDPNGTYQPFVFLVSYSPDGPVTDVWFSYYKDLRPAGRLKLGYGPGGPPVLGKAKLLELLRRLLEVGVISPDELDQLIPTRDARGATGLVQPEEPL
jgi:hypothetical protein